MTHERNTNRFFSTKIPSFVRCTTQKEKSELFYSFIYKSWLFVCLCACVCVSGIHTQILGLIFNSDVLTKPISKWHLLIHILWFAIHTKIHQGYFNARTNIISHVLQQFIWWVIFKWRRRNFHQHQRSNIVWKVNFQRHNKSWCALILTNSVRILIESDISIAIFI